MSHELSLRQKAIRWKQAGRCVSWICQQLEHSREWFYKWWNRYQAEGASGLRDRSHAPQSSPQRWSGEMRQAILDMRDRLMRRRGPRARYRLAGAATIRHELACLGYDPLPSLRTVERVLQQGDRTSPAFRPEPCTSSSSYPDDPSDAQQPATSAGSDRTALLEGLAAAVVLPGLPGRLRWGRFCRFSAKTSHGRGPGICRASLAAVGTARYAAGRQQRALRADISSRFPQSLHPPGTAGRDQPHLHPRTRTLAQWKRGALQRVAAGTYPGHPLAFCPRRSGAN